MTDTRPSWSSRYTRAGQGAVVFGTYMPARAGAWAGGAIGAWWDRWWAGPSCAAHGRP